MLDISNDLYNGMQALEGAAAKKKLTKEEKIAKRRKKLKKRFKGGTSDPAYLTQDLEFECKSIYLKLAEVCENTKGSKSLWNDTIYRNGNYQESDLEITGSKVIINGRENVWPTTYQIKTDIANIVKGGKTYPIYKGTFYNLRFVPIPGDDYDISMEWTITFSFDSIGFIAKHIDDETKVAKTLLTMFNHYYKSNKNSISSIYDLSKRVKPTNPINEVVKLSDGTLLYVPKDTVDNRKAFIAELSGDAKYAKKNSLILLDLNQEKFVQTTSSGEVEEVDVSEYLSMTDENILRFLESTFLEIINYFPRTALDGVPQDLADYQVENSDKRIPELDGDKVDKIFKKIRDNLGSVEDHKWVPRQYFNYYAHVEVVIKNHRKYQKLKNKIQNRRKNFNNANVSTLSPVHAAYPDLKLFPHQADVIAKMQHAGDIAVLDIATGGGKTPLLIYDITYLMAEGKIKKPLVIMPNFLIGGWIDKILFFTGDKYNPMSVVPETLKSWKPDRLKAMVKSAPPNTIFLTSYEFLRAGRIQEGDINIYPNADMVKEWIHPDYVALDESHRIKNNSQTTDCIMEFRDAKVKRLATGTLVANTLKDLVKQIGWLDNRVFGTEKDFENRYAAEVTRGKITKYVKDAEVGILNDIKNGTFYINKREKDWAAVLPKKVTNYYWVEFNDLQKARYKDILNDTIESIKADPVLGELWDKWCDQDPDDEASNNDLFAPLIAKLVGLEQYTTAPDYDDFVRGLESSDAGLSSKLEKVDELISDSFSRNEKVLVGVHYQAAAMHLFQHSKHNKVAAYYDASQKELIPRFQDPDSNVRVVFAVIQSMKEGLDLPIAKRVIMCDVDWTPGNTKQFIARAWRPEGSEIKKDEILNIDFVLTEGTVDMLKFGRLVAKKIQNSKATDGCEIAAPIIPTVDLNGLMTRSSHIAEHMRKEKEFEGWVSDEVEAERAKGNWKFVIPRHAKLPLAGSKTVDFPWTGTMKMLHTGEGVPLRSWLEKEGYDISDPTLAKHRLHGAKVRTEYGTGLVIGIYKKQVAVELLDGVGKGKKCTSKISKTILLEVEPEELTGKMQRRLAKRLLREEKKRASADKKKKRLEDREKRKEDRVKKKDKKQKLKEKLKEEKEKKKDGKQKEKGKVSPKDKKKLAEIAKKIRALKEKYSKLKGKNTPTAKDKKQAIKEKIRKLREQKQAIKEKYAGVDKKVDKKTDKKKDKKVDKKTDKKKGKKEKAESSTALDINFMLYNGLFSLVGEPDSDEFVKLFKSLKFKPHKDSWIFPVKSRKLGYKVLHQLEDKYKIPQKNLDLVEEVLESMTKSKVMLKNIPKVQVFYKLLHRKVPKGTLRIYPLIEDDKVYLAVDAGTHPGVTLTKYRFKKSKDLLYYLITNKKVSIKSTIRKIIQKGFKIKDIDGLNDNLKKYMKSTILTSLLKRGRVEKAKKSKKGKK